VISLTLYDFRNILLEVIGAVYHFRPPENTPEKYILWGETGEGDTIQADEKTHELTLKGILYYYTRTEYDDVFDQICKEFNENEIAWSISAIGYNDTTREITYELHWEIMCGEGEIYRKR
jgi:hypothetical protein